MAGAALKAARKDLLAVALTCKTLSLSAIKLLWRRLDNFAPLLSLSPSFKHRQIELCGVIQRDEWDLLDRHAAHVREIVYDPGYSAVSPLVQMCLATRKSPLFTNLLRFRCFSRDVGPQILLFLSPSLLSVEITSQRMPSSSINGFIGLLFTECPRLSHLKAANLPPAMLSHLNGFQQLRSIDLRDLTGPITTAAFTTIAALPDLSSFITDLSGWSEIDFDGLQPGRSFTRLTHLEIHTTAALSRVHIPRLIPWIETTSMRSIVIAAPAPARRGDTDVSGTFPLICDTVCSRWAATLEALNLHGLRCTTVEEFSPLVCVSGLRTVKLDDVLTESLNDSRVLDVIKGWSNLVSLSFRTGTADCSFLQCIVQHCPNITELEVPFWPTTLPPLPEKPPTSHGLDKLTVVKVPGSTLAYIDVHLLARHLDLVFPRIRTIHCLRDSGWDQVDKLVKMCQDVRRRTMAMGGIS
ncbi:hypothetical protein FB451DRAFT_1446679 [Mycena latifolia]|nr:hypothetical protein FB451DRAFT_1446679 [Mycena latifolia]